MPSSRSLFTFSLLTLILPLLTDAQSYDFGHPPPSLPTNSGPAQKYTPPNPNPPQGSYNVNPAPNKGSYGSDPSPSPSKPGIYVAPSNPYLSKPPSQYIPNASPVSNPVYGAPPSNPTPLNYISLPSYGSGVDPSGPILPFQTSFTFSAGLTISNATILNGGAATNTASAGGAFSSSISLPTAGGCACLTQATIITTIILTNIFTVTSVLTEFKTETITVQMVLTEAVVEVETSFVGVPVVSSVVLSPPTFITAPTTSQISTAGLSLNSSSTIQTSGGLLSTAMISSPMGVVVPSQPSRVVPPVYGSLLSYASPAGSSYGSPPTHASASLAGYGQPPSYTSPPSPSGYGQSESHGSSPLTSYGSPSGYEEGKNEYSSQAPSYEEDGIEYGSRSPNYNQPSTQSNEGDNEDGSSSYGDSGEREGDMETGLWGLSSGPDFEDSGIKSKEQGGGSVFFDWLLEILT